MSNNVKHTVDFNGKPLTEDDLENLVTKAVNNFGAPDQLTLGGTDYSKLISFFNLPDALNPIMQRIASKLHGMLKIGKITWEDENVITGATTALENIGVFKHVPKE